MKEFKVLGEFRFMMFNATFNTIAVICHGGKNLSI